MSRVRSAVVVMMGVVVVVGACTPPAAPAGSPSGPSEPTESTGPGRATATVGGGLRLVVEPADGYHSVRALIGDARRTIDVTMYELDDRRIEDQLVAAHRRGCSVRVLLDRAFHGEAVNAGSFARLAAAGVAVRWGPARLIVHQKTLTVDDDVSAIMTGNLTGSDEPGTRDFVVVDRNPTAVSAIVKVFSDDWGGGTVQAVPTAADLVWSPGSGPAFIGLIDSARRSLTVENEEMGAPEIERALEAAARRGVHVELVMTADAGWDRALAALARDGVRVATSPDSGQALYLHAKAIVADGETAFVGSQNFSTPSLDDNRELGVITDDRAVVQPVAATLASDFARAAAPVAPRSVVRAPRGWHLRHSRSGPDLAPH